MSEPTHPPDDQILAPNAPHPKSKPQTVGNTAPTVAEGEVIRETREIKRLLIRQSRSRRSIHIGPLPPAAELRKYDQATPGAADRIIKMAELEQIHGQTMDREVPGSRQKDRESWTELRAGRDDCLGCDGFGVGINGP